jgi:hypothetical protein
MSKKSNNNVIEVKDLGAFLSIMSNAIVGTHTTDEYGDSSFKANPKGGKLSKPEIEKLWNKATGKGETA